MFHRHEQLASCAHAVRKEQHHISGDFCGWKEGRELGSLQKRFPKIVGTTAFSTTQPAIILEPHKKLAQLWRLYKLQCYSSASKGRLAEHNLSSKGFTSWHSLVFIHLAKTSLQDSSQTTAVSSTLSLLNHEVSRENIRSRFPGLILLRRPLTARADIFLHFAESSFTIIIHSGTKKSPQNWCSKPWRKEERGSQ